MCPVYETLALAIPAREDLRATAPQTRDFHVREALCGALEHTRHIRCERHKPKHLRARDTCIRGNPDSRYDMVASSCASGGREKYKLVSIWRLITAIGSR